MPRAKRSSDNDEPTIPAKDLAAFKAALGGGSEDDGIESTETEIETRAAAGDGVTKKIPVAIEANPNEPEEPKGDVAEGISEVWQDQPKKTVPAQKFDRARRQWPWGWIITGVMLVAAAAVAGFFVFNHQAKFTGNNIQVVVNAPKEIASGADIAITIDLQNQEAVDLINGQLTVEYPDGFTYDSSNVATSNDFHNAFPIGKLGSGRSTQVVIHGTVIGSVNAHLTFSATLTYRPANFSSDFQEQGNASVTITSSILNITIDGPTKVAPGASAVWTITAKNTSDHDIKHVRLTATLPDGLTVTKANPSATDSNNVWDIATLAKAKSSTITLTGTAQGNLGDSLELQVQAGIVASDGTVDIQDEQSDLIILVNTGLSTTIAVNGQTDSSVVNPGDVLNYTLSVANKSDSEVNDVVVAATIGGSGFDMTTLANPLQAAVKNQALTWTKQQVPGLAQIDPGHTVSLTFSLGTSKTLSVKSDSDRNPHVSLSVAVTSPSLSANTNTAVAPVVSLTKFATVFTVAADARYYDDSLAKVGSGPVPPVVGQTTAYRVTWAVTNSTSDASTMVVSTTLPVGVLWTGQNIGRDAGDISFDPTSRTVTWTLNTVPAGTGSRLPTLTAHFEVSITPTADQVGAVVVLTDSTVGSATDSYSAKAISVTVSSLTSDVPNDPQAAGEGKVAAS